MASKNETVAKAIVRFYSKIVIHENGCWLWQASAANKFGHGRFYWKLKNYQAHRVAWTIERGSMPILQICHKCDVPKCCNPDHLFEGTQMDNVRDMITKGRAKKSHGERHFAAKLTATDVIEIRERKMAGATYREITNNFKINHKTAWNVVNLKTWRHVR
jgi:HNH endonuclease